MKLVIATPLYPPEIGGPATYAKLLFEGLPAKGIEVELVKFSEVRHLPKIIRHYAYYRRVLRAARNADAVLALDPVSVGLPAMKAAKKAAKPFVVKIVGDYAWEQGRQRFGVTENLNQFLEHKQDSFFVNRLRQIETKVAKGASKIITPSAYLKHVVTQWGIKPEKIVIIHNAIKEESEKEIGEEIKKLLAPKVVSVGRLVPWKNFHELIDAVAEARKRIPDLSLVIVGDGPDREALEKHARESLKHNYLIAGQRTREETWNIMANGFMFVLSSDYEGYAHTLIEARLIGIPIITTRIDGNTPDLVEDGKTGLLVNPHDTKALSNAIVRLVTEPGLADELKRNSKIKGGDFSVDTMLAQTATLLKQLV
jgi:glycosyltransferase involved in cell wall biosynthesis